MQLNEEEFKEKFTEALDAAVAAMAESPEIEPGRFFSMVCILENLQYFSPVIYSVLKSKTEE